MMEKLTVDRVKPTYRISWTLIFASVVASIGAIQFGWNTGVINNPQNVITNFVNMSGILRYGSVTDDFLTGIMATIVAIFAAGGLFGALLAGWWGDKLGRRVGMAVNCIVMIISGLFMLLSKYALSYEMIIIGRFIAGFGSGLYTGLVPIYLNEIAPIDIRGSIGLLMQFGVVIGLFLSQVVGLSMIMGNELLWNYLLGVNIIFAVIQGIGLKFCPASPKFLLYFKQNEQGAFKALEALRSANGMVEQEFVEMKTELSKTKDIQKLNLLSILKHKGLRMALLVGIVLHMSQQFSGINNMFYYSSILFETVNVKKSDVQFATLGVGFIMIVMTIISIPLIDRCGRRLLYIGGLLGCMITAILFTIFYTYKTVNGLNYLSIVSALLFVASFGIGPGSVPWIMIPEMFPESCRSSATSVGISVNWLSNLIVGLIFKYLLEYLNNLIFVPYIFIHAFSILFLYFQMPETKGLTPEEVTKYLPINVTHANYGYSNKGDTSDESNQIMEMDH